MKKFLIVLLLLLATSFSFAEKKRISVGSSFYEMAKLDLEDIPLWYVTVNSILPFKDSYIIEFTYSSNNKLYTARFLVNQNDSLFIGKRDDSFNTIFTKYIIKDIKPNVMIIESVDD